MSFWGVIQIISAIAFFMGFGMYFGAGVTYALTNGEEIPCDTYYDLCFLTGSISFITFVIAIIANHGLVFFV